VGPSSQLIAFNIQYGQLPENLTLAPGGLDVVLNGAAEVAHVSSAGTLTVLGTLPAPAGGGTGTPLLKMPLTAGIVRASNGTVYTTGGKAHVWAKGEALKGTTSFGANGLKVHGGYVWVSNTSRGTILQIPILDNGSSGKPTVAAHGLTTVDDFQFVGQTDEIVAALNAADEVALVQPNGSHKIVLTAADGLENPSSIAVSGKTVYVANAAYYTGKDPSILVTHLR